MHKTLGLMTVTLRYAYLRPGTIYFQRAIPEDLWERYGRKRVKVKLDTLDMRVAARLIERLNREVEATWKVMRAAPKATAATARQEALELLDRYGLSPEGENDQAAKEAFYDSLELKREAHAKGDEWVYRDADGGEYLTPAEVEAAQLLAGTVKPVLTDALTLYLRLHPKGSERAFKLYAQRTFDGLVAVIQDMEIDDLSRDHAHRYVEAMIKKGLATASIRRQLNSIRAVFEMYWREQEIEKRNPFSLIPIKSEGKDAKRRIPFTAPELSKLGMLCRAKDDDVRHIVSMLADSGARLAEIVGLALDDIDLEAETPHVAIQPHPWRSLKNVGSERNVPLVGQALWAAKRIKANAKPKQRFAFPRYTDGTNAKSTHASNTISKWLRAQGLEHTAHDLRHTLTDRLRAVGCPEDIRLAVGGWATQGVGNKYGLGHGLQMMGEWLAKIADDRGNDGA